MHQPMKKPIRSRAEAGETVLEFAAALPLFLLLVAGIVLFAWLFWAQAVADIAAVRALKEGTVNRGGAADPAAGSAFFADAMGTLTGSQTSGAVGDVQVAAGERTLQFGVAGTADLSFGPIDTVYTFGGGGFGRLWRFWPGPPEGWE